jgi:hypothetical protein
MEKHWDKFYEEIKELGVLIKDGVILSLDGRSRIAWRDDGEFGEFLRIVSSCDPDLYGRINDATTRNNLGFYPTSYACGGEPGLGPSANF